MLTVKNMGYKYGFLIAVMQLMTGITQLPQFPNIKMAGNTMSSN
jgi:hypothetical protein